MRPTVGKEKLLERMMTLSKAKADDSLRLLDARRDEVDDWGSLSTVHEVAFGDSMRRPCGVRARGRPRDLVRRGEVFWAEHPKWRHRPAV
jgi:hypothetical protein